MVSGGGVGDEREVGVGMHEVGVSGGAAVSAMSPAMPSAIAIESAIESAMPRARSRA